MQECFLWERVTLFGVDFGFSISRPFKGTAMLHNTIKKRQNPKGQNMTSSKRLKTDLPSDELKFSKERMLSITTDGSYTPMITHLSISFTISFISEGWVSGFGSSVELEKGKIFLAHLKLCGQNKCQKIQSNCELHRYSDGSWNSVGWDCLEWPLKGWMKMKTMWITHCGWCCHHL